jgi:polysaccharide biosynthesis transport protein
VEDAVERIIDARTTAVDHRGRARDTIESWVDGSLRRAPGPRGFREYLRIIYRHRWLTTLTFLAVMIPIALWGILQPPAYEASVRLVLNPELAVPVSFGDSSRQQSSGQSTGPDAPTQQEVLRSHNVVHRTIVALRLWEDPGAAALTAPSTTAAHVKRLLRLEPAAATPATARGSMRDEHRTDALVEICAARIRVVPHPFSRLTDVIFEAPTARLASDFVNELARQFIKDDIEARANAARRSSIWLKEQVEEQGRKMEAADASLQHYKEQRGALSVDDRQNIVIQRLSDLNAAVTKARTDRLAKEGAFKQVQQAESNTAALESIPAIASDLSVRQARAQLVDLQQQLLENTQRYGDRHPAIVKLQVAIQSAGKSLHDRATTAAEVIRNDYLAALGQEQEQMRELEEQKKNALRLNEQHLEYGRLQREAETNRHIYNSLLEQLQQVGITGTYEQSAIRIIKEASPPVVPVRPQPTKFAALAFVMGLCSALTLAFLREFTDPRIKTPQQLQEDLQLPFLGLIPDTKPIEGEACPTFAQAPPSLFSDAMRRVRGNLRIAAPDAGPHVLLVTSAAPREGKTTVCVALAQCFAIATQRVLLVDGDLRRPGVHRTMLLQSRRGLSEYLSGKAELDEVLQATDFENLSVIVAGEVAENASELLGLARMRELLHSLRPRFDWILIDSAPVLSAPDTTQLAQVASGILFVVAAELVPRDQIVRAEQELMKTRVPFAGSVLNRARVRRHGYYYAPYYNRAYESFYSKPS